jgi:hypothetical protein
MDINGLLNQVKQAIFNDPTTPHREGHDPSGLIGNIEGLFSQHQATAPNAGQVMPAAQDPYGDPANAGRSYGYASPAAQFPGVRPASQDPRGDPGNTPSSNIRPASEDPLGDPADQ